jgi:hypothetical protein
MTDENTKSLALLEPIPDADFLRGKIDFAAKQIMELEVRATTGIGRQRRVRAP